MRAKGCIMGKRGVIALIAALACAALTLLLLPRAALPAFSEALKARAENLTAYDYALIFDESAGTLAVTATIDYLNDTGETLTTLAVRTYAGAFSTEEYSPAALDELYDFTYPDGFSAGAMALMGTWWNGEIVQSAYLDSAQTALSIPIPPLEHGARGTLTLRLLLTLPRCAYRYGEAEGIYAVGNALPVMAIRQNGAWRTDAYLPIGDPFLSDCANYTLSLTLPSGFIPACTAHLTEQNGVWTGAALAVRDVALTFSREYVVRERVSGGVLLRSLARTAAGADRALSSAARAMTLFSELYGAYPYPVFTVAETAFAFDGMEYPCLTMIGAGMYLESEQASLELTVAHEAAHQWFYALVGSDQVNDPWQDEALCEYAVLRYAARYYGQSSADTLRAYRVDAPMREMIPGDLTPGSPLDYFGDYTSYAAVVYGRGAALLFALDEFLPGGADGFLRTYCEQFAFGIASRADFTACLNACAGSDLAPLLTDYLDTTMH